MFAPKNGIRIIFDVTNTTPRTPPIKCIGLILPISGCVILILRLLLNINVKINNANVPTVKDTSAEIANYAFAELDHC